VKVLSKTGGPQALNCMRPFAPVLAWLVEALKKQDKAERKPQAFQVKFRLVFNRRFRGLVSSLAVKDNARGGLGDFSNVKSCTSGRQKIASEMRLVVLKIHAASS
jgi:hypothetical protein